jgi:hypothetical protein
VTADAITAHVRDFITRHDTPLDEDVKQWSVGQPCKAAVRLGAITR